MAEQTFVNGMIVKRRENAPDFVKCNVSFKVEDFIEFAKQHSKDGWLNVDVKESQKGMLYATLDNWKPKPRNDRPSQDSDDMPF